MEKSDSSARARTVILDAGPLIHLDELGCLSLLTDFDDVLIPAAVWEEVERHRPAALSRISFAKKHAAAMPDKVLALRDAFNLDRGETGQSRSVLLFQEHYY